MRQISILKQVIWVITVCIGVMGIANGQQDSKPISWKDVPSWKSLAPNGAIMSPDGKWVAYGIVPVDGDGDLFLQKVGDTVLKKYPIGGNAFLSMAFSEDGKWVAFKEAAKSKELKAAAKPGGKQVYDKLHVLDLVNDKITTFDKVASFAFNGKAASHLGLVMSRERATGAPSTGAPKGGDFLLLELASGKSQNIGNVANFGFNKAGDWLAYTIDAANQAGNGVHLYNVVSKQTNIIESDKANYQSLNWKEEGDAFAVLKMVKDEKFKQDHGKVIGVKNISVNPTVVVYDPQKDSLAFPKGKTISPNRNPIWTEDLTRVLFGIHNLELAKKEPEKADAKIAPNKDSLEKVETAKLAKIKADTSIKTVADLQKAIAKIDPKAPVAEKIDTIKPDMTIWHWKDKRLQARQQVLQQMDKNFFHWAMYDTRNQKFTQLNDSTVRSLSPMPKHQYAIATDISNYELDINLDGQNFQDIYLVDLNSGKAEKVFDKFYLPSFTSYPRASPDGKKFAYGKDGHFYVYDIASKNHINISEGVPTSFVNIEDDHNVIKPLTNIIDWSSDSKYLIVRDLWDIWQVPISTKEKAVNLTQNGRRDGIRYQMRFATDPEEKGIDLTKPMYVRMYGEATKKSGIGMLQATAKGGIKPGVQALVWEDANIGRFSKAKNADVYSFSKEQFNMPTEYFVSNSTLLANALQVTKNAPAASKFAWSKGTMLVNYVSDKGDSLQGALFLPANYVQGSKYPTIVYYYEKLSQTLHNWNNPGFGGTGWNPTIYTSNGYAVFIPDIVYKLDDPGMSAVWCVLPAVKEAIKTGVIDGDKIGIHGHSWGGYQTSFLITQTNMFKAAAAGAPLTNMVSMYDLIYWNSGSGNMSIFEASQGRFRGAPWENWDSYLRNSPVYHVKQVNTPLLLLHNDKDGAVDFTQGIEYYNALRRLKKPVVMMQYKGENHGLSKLENRKDYSVRMMEFFDHHLKGAPAPDWWTEGVDHLKLSEHLDKRVF
jgi:dipeptidyl aminopeptidase/acylaminoacyl peptidase